MFWVIDSATPSTVKPVRSKLVKAKIRRTLCSEKYGRNRTKKTCRVHVTHHTRKLTTSK